MTESKPSCWVLTEGIAGTEKQCLALAAALGLDPVVKRLALRAPWKQLSPWLPFASCALAPGSDPVAPPWPDVLLASGRKSVGAALHIRRKSGGRTFAVQVQDPRVDPARFDLVVAPLHDGLRGENVVPTTGALHHMPPGLLAAEGRKWEPRLAHLPRPRVAVLIGGSSRAFTMTRENALRLADGLAGLGAGLMVTVSRRTGADNTALLRERLSGPGVFFWDGKGDNPIHGFMALADYIVVTADSVSMLSEAVSTGKPVYIAPLDGGARRLGLFHKLLKDKGYARPFTGVLESWSYTPPRDMERVAGEIRKRMNASCPEHTARKS